GIFLMNVEWFTRPIAELGTGVDVSQTGINYVASWMIYTFVQGKFWTMFSLLFGMGFAVMLGRAQSADRGFVTPYIRRIIGLFLFGSAHYVMVWTGDILHNYAVTAIFLLLITTNSWRTTLGLLLSFAATGVAVFFTLGKDSVGPFGMHAMLLTVVLVASYFLNRGSVARYWKWGVTLYSLPFAVMLAVTAVSALKPIEAVKAPAKQEQVATRPAANAAAKLDRAKPEEKDEATQRAENKAKREKKRLEEIALYTKGSYYDSLVFRTKEYIEDLPFAAGLSFLALPMFLIGFWFVRSGVIGNIQQNLPLFRRLAVTALPIGLLMTLASGGLHSNLLNADWEAPSNRIAQTLFQWGMMPQSIGYVALLICCLYTPLGKTLLSPLRFAGQMALTNYISANAIGMFFFSGYGLGYWGQVPRAGQVVFVFTVFALQLIFSWLWLSRFRYGPAEWVWRAITYWQIPAMRRDSGTATAAA
ncbi:MAG: DUF418 domain-containing protein, partial [Frankiaceae bacterium]|nr:DUF418 domain-containing protein [Arenimonas sp.]